MYYLFVKALFYLLAKHVDISLIDIFAFLDQGNCIVNLNVSQLFFVLLPILIQNKKQLLCSSCWKNWQQTFTSAFHYFFYFLSEYLLPYMSGLVNSCSECWLWYQNINVGLRYFCLHNISILFTTVVSGVKHLDSVNFNQKHGSSNNMSSNIWCYLNALLLHFDSKIYFDNSSLWIFNLLAREQGLLLVSNFKSIFDQIFIDIAGWSRHEHFFLVLSICQKIGQCSTMIEMCMSNNDHG